ncbi:MAG: aldo/keto reductase [Candidatus Dormibacteraeota bacterium]|nr:aldo/keto reductase [Candidatus Dormibacteraeota bacterium]
MRYVEVSGARMSVIGLGCWQFGSREWGYGDDYARTEAAAIVKQALDDGITLIDTAEFYGLGRSEAILGRAIADRRSQVFLATKILPLFPIASIVAQRAHASARRLGVLTIDLYQLHFPNPLVPLSRSMAGMRQLQRLGLVEHVGVSNYSLKGWQTAERALGSPVLSNQVQFSLVRRNPLRDLVPYAQHQGRVIIAYSPLAQGMLSGRYDATHRPGGTVRRRNGIFSPANLDRASGLITALREIGKVHGATPSQIALAWLIRIPNVVAIPGASRASQVVENAAAADIALSGEEAERLLAEAERFSP